MLQVCKQLFEKWNSDVRYCHWKSNEHLEEGLNGETDLDVFVIPKDKNKAEKYLCELNYIKMQPQKSHLYPLVDEWLGFDHETGALVHVHLHYQIITGTKFVKEYVFPLNDEIIATRIQDKETGVYVTHPELEAIILFCRIALKSKDKKNIKPSKDSQREIDYIKQRIEIKSLLELCECLLGNPSGTKLCDVILMDSPGKNDWYTVYHIATKWLAPYKKMGGFNVLLRHKYYHYLSKLEKLANNKLGCNLVNKKIIPNSSLSICFIGQDGCGKSTVSQEIDDWLSWKLSSKRFYLGSGEHYKSTLKTILSFGSKHSKRDIKIKHRNSSESTSSKSRGGILRYALRKIAATFDSINRKDIAEKAYKTIIKSHAYIQNGGIAIYDRFPQNQFHGIYDGPKIRNFRLKGMSGFFTNTLANREEYYINMIQKFQPTIVFKMLLSPEESIRRKPFEDFDNVSKKHEITQKLEFMDSKVFIIDATQPYKEEIKQIKRIIWNQLLKKQL